MDAFSLYSSHQLSGVSYGDSQCTVFSRPRQRLLFFSMSMIGACLFLVPYLEQPIYALIGVLLVGLPNGR